VSERLAFLFDLAHRSTRLNMSVMRQLDCWRKVAEQAAEENNQEIFDTAEECATLLEKRFK
jgi:hypothetical protein